MLRPLLLLLSLSASLTAAAAPVRVILVGDSTMQGRTGYGDVFCQRFVPAATCINVARGGRSSASFRAEGRWDQVRALLREPGYGATYVLIQFGHNDQPGKPGRSTDLVNDFPRNMARYAAEAKQLGAVPVLVTPLTRRSFKGAYLHDDLAPWSAATRQVARAGKVALLDLNALSVKAVQAMGQEQADTLAQEGAFDRTHLGLKGAVLFSKMVAIELKRLFPALGASMRADAGVSSAIPARQSAPADGWAALDGGTRGGAGAGNDHVYTVTNAAELRAAIASGAAESKIIKVAGIIDMRGATPFASTADQEARATLHIPSNTTLIGLGPRAGFVNAQLRLAKVEEVIIRNLHFQNPCDVGPVWEPLDGPTGGWNAKFDSISVSGSTHVWIDHNSFTDAPLTDDKLPLEHGQPRQCHDGALDIKDASDFITVSYNHFARHNKNLLVGSNDNATDDVNRLRVTFSNNLFEHVSARAPRVRYGRVHTFNNYHVGDRKHPVYPHQHSIGVGKDAYIISENNAFDVAGARSCEDIVHHFNGAAWFTDFNSLLNGHQLPECALARSLTLWSTPYAYTLRPVQEVSQHVQANAGAGKELTFPNPVTQRSPAEHDVPVPPDTLLRIGFAQPPMIGAIGTVRIYRQSDGALVDTIVPGEEVRAIGAPGLDARRHVRQAPIRVRRNNLLIAPHAGALKHGQAYFVTVDPSMRWSFRTTAAPRGTTIVVDDDGPADFRTVQGALDHAMTAFDKATPVTIEIRNGDYEELLFIRNKDNLTIRGESRDGVMIHATNNNSLNPGSGASQGALAPGGVPTGGRSLLLVEASDLLTIDTLSMTNDTLRSERKSGQAETLFFNNDSGRLVVRNAAFFSEQDTIQVKGYSWFYRTKVEGNVDFIWGANRVTLFEESELRSVGDSARRTAGGWVVQARTVTADDKGFVFLNSTLKYGISPGPDAVPIPPGSTYLARSPGRATSWDNVIFINCKIHHHIAADGWARDGMNKQPLPNPVKATATRGWREYGNRDSAGKPVRFGGLTLTADEIAQHFGSRAAIFSAWDGGRGWNPQ